MANIYKQTQLSAINQVLKTFEEPYEVEKRVLNKFDDNGRLSTIRETVQIIGFIRPSGSRMILDSKGHGERKEKTFKLTMSSEHFISEGDYINTKAYGKLRVSEIDDRTEFGVLGATLTKVGTYDKTENNK